MTTNQGNIWEGNSAPHMEPTARELAGPGHAARVGGSYGPAERFWPLVHDRCLTVTGDRRGGNAWK